MNKMPFTLFLTLLFILSSLFSMAKKPDESVMKEVAKLRLIEPYEHNIRIICPSLDGGVYFINDFVLSKKDIVDNKVYFILNGSFILTEVTSNNVNIPMEIYHDYQPNDFEPAVEADMYAIMKVKCRIYELAFDDIEHLPELVPVRLKYHVKEGLDSDAVFSNNEGKVIFNGKYFWYPRNLNLEGTISLLVRTTDKIAFSLDGNAMTYTMKQKYEKEYKHIITDNTEKPATIIFHSKKLK